jgi:hypothetical protein
MRPCLSAQVIIESGASSGPTPSVHNARDAQCAAAACGPFLPRLPATSIRKSIPVSCWGAGAAAAGEAGLTDICCSMASDRARVDCGTARANASLSSAYKVTHQTERGTKRGGNGASKQQLLTKRRRLASRGSAGRGAGGAAAGCGCAGAAASLAAGGAGGGAGGGWVNSARRPGGESGVSRGAQYAW